MRNRVDDTRRAAIDVLICRSNFVENRLLDYCETISRLPESAGWFSAEVAHDVERLGKTVGSLTLDEVSRLIEAAEGRAR